MKILHYCVLLSVFLATAAMQAQNYAYVTGAPAFSTRVPIDNGFINVNNGDIHIEIPLAVHQQRGRLQLNERLVYDSRIWRIINNSGYSWSPTNVPSSLGGWVYSSGTQAGTYTYNTYGDNYLCNAAAATLLPYTQYWNFSWSDPSGTQHFFPTTHTQYYNSQQLPVKCLTYSGSPVGEIPTSSGYAADGSGYYAVVSNYTTLTVYDQQGNQYSPTSLDATEPTGSSQVSDTNGNDWTQDLNGNLVDTLGRTPVLVSTSGKQTFYDVLGFKGARNRYTVTTQTVSYHTAFGQPAVGEVSGSFTAIQSIMLPDGSAYSFTYDSGTAAGNYGELTSVSLPTGGTVQYTYSNFLDSFQNQNRWVQTRVRDGGTTKFAPSVISKCSGSSGCQEKTVVTSPLGDDTVYTFTLDNSGLLNASSWNTAADIYSGSSSSGGTRLKSLDTSYAYATQGILLLEGGTTETQIATYEAPTSVTTNTILPDAGVTSQVVEALDATYARPKSVNLWDFYSSSGGPSSSPTIQTIYSYNDFFPSIVTVNDGSGNQVSQTSYLYDEPTGPGHAALVATSGLSNHNPASGSRYNLTTVSQWLNTSSSPMTWEASYDDAGNTLTSTDPDGATSYSHDAGDAFVTMITPPTPASGVSLPYSATYDPSTGLLLTETDPNQKMTSYISYDWNGRPTEIQFPDLGEMIGSYPATQTSIQYYMTPSTLTNSQTLYDGYGRTSRVAIGNGQSSNPYYQTDTCYDLDGRPSFQSYRYQGTGWGTSKVCSGAGDAMTYDALGRPASIAHDNLSVVNYKYAGRATEIIDENNATRIVQTDALDRTSAVCEISSNNSMPGGSVTGACGLDYAGNGFITNYAYSLSNHSTTITQGAQTRSFQTDSLGRSIATTEPERATTTYTYKYSGQGGLGLAVTRKRGTANQSNASNFTTTTTQLDSLGRVVSVVYSDGTPGKYFGYDQSAGWLESSQQTNMKGRLSTHIRYLSVGNASSIYGYDAMGRVTAQISCQPSGCGNSAYDRQIDYSYNTAGMLTSESDGAGDTYTYSRSPAGEITGVTESIANASNPANLIVPGSVQNGPFGPLNYSLGNGLTVVNTYDVMGRQSGGWVCAGSSQPSCTGGTAQLYGYTVSRPGLLVTQTCDTVLSVCNGFSYDEFDRLTARTVNQGTSQNFTYTYDRYGNRWTQNPLQSGPSVNISFNQGNNMINTLGFANDVVGNVTEDSSHQYSFDAEGNLTAVDSGQTAAYYYDSMNQRVRIAPTRGTYEFAFDVFGRRVSTWAASTHSFVEANAYTDSNPLAIRTSGIQFEHQNWLNTERVRTSNTGSNVVALDSLPWGDGLTPSGDNGDQHDFAGMDRDLEDNSEHAQYRQYSTNYGRWLSPDPSTASYDFTRPQSLNRYSYALNDPNDATDPSGLDGSGGGSGVGGCVGAVESGGLNPSSDLGCGEAIYDLISGLFGGPSFHGSLNPRPNGGWDGNFGESLGLPKSVPHGDWGIGLALGLPTDGCDFGACGGLSNYGEGQSTVAVASVLGGVCILLEPCPLVVGIGIGVIGLGVADIVHQVESNEDQPAAQSAECLAEWTQARDFCSVLMSNPKRLRRSPNIWGGSFDKCVRGQVSQRCGGNKVG